jgi:hypothetical protein
MTASVILDNLLNPPILFFFLGVLATLVRSDLEIPQPIARFLALYLLMAIGLKGGVELRAGDGAIWSTLAAAMVMASLVPLYSFYVLKRRVNVANAAAICATYGSISAVTFITASDFLRREGIESSGAMVAAMALMESPAIIIGVLLYRLYERRADAAAGTGAGTEQPPAAAGETRRLLGIDWGDLFRDAVLNASIFLLVGSLLIGALIGHDGGEVLKPFTTDIFTGMLCFFLLDMGLVAARRLNDLRKTGVFLVLFALLAPLVNGTLGGLVAGALGMPLGNAMLFIVLCASASYIAVPAAVRLSIPAANPSLYLPMALAITFPLNITLGLPLYLQYARWVSSWTN